MQLSQNKLEVSPHLSLCSRLSVLNIRQNKLTLPFQMPREDSSVCALEQIFLGCNELQDIHGWDFGCLSSTLAVLDLSDNRLVTLPDEVL